MKEKSDMMQTEEQFQDWLTQHLLAPQHWLQQFELAKKGVEQSVVAIALLYKAHQNFEQANEWFNTAVLLGNTEAMYELGNIYFELEEEVKSFTMYKMAAQLGHPDAMNNLADMYFNGEGIAQDDRLALHWFTKAAECGVVEAMYTLGIMYEQGLGTTTDNQQALEFYMAAAHGGDIEGLYRLGMIYFEGELGQLQNREQAIYYFEQAAEQFHLDALFNLAYITELEEGMTEKAIHFYKQASLIGDLASTRKLVQYYEQINEAHAQKWREKLTYLEQDGE